MDVSSRLHVVPCLRIIEGPKLITNTILGAPYYNHSILGPNSLFKLLRPLYERTLR